MSLPRQQLEILLVICGAGPLKDVTSLISQLNARGWNVQALATPSAVDMGLSLNDLRQQTATVNTISKLALDIRDTYAGGVLGQAVAAKIPMIILPSIKKVDLERAVFRNYIESLRREGVKVLLGGSDGIHPTNASSKDGPVPPFPWHLAVEAVAASTNPQERNPRRSDLSYLIGPFYFLAVATATLVFIRYQR
ncbi:flavoprotein [Favolaschia claudopus]|uniref:Flavoprotein n=1 Tax=Favolaschia claudopus TaxID=2862362 RepID=A0AAV9ZBY9_9AGAR